MHSLSSQALVPNKVAEIAKIEQIPKISSNLPQTLKPSPTLSSMPVVSDPEGMPNPNQQITITSYDIRRKSDRPPASVTAIKLCRVSVGAYGQKSNESCEVFYPVTRVKPYGAYDVFTPGKQDPESFRQRVEAAWVAVFRKYDDTFTANRIAWSGRSRWVPKEGGDGREWKTSWHLVVQGFVSTLRHLNAFIQHHKQDLLAGEGLDEGVYNKREQLFNMVGACKGLKDDMHTLLAVPEGGAYHEHIVQHLTGEELELAELWTPPAALGDRPNTKKRRSAQELKDWPGLWQGLSQIVVCRTGACWPSD